MDRLTTHSHKTGTAVPSARLGDICLRINGCDDYDFCEGCPINELLTKLCAYEDTGLTPEQVELLTKPSLSKSAWTGKKFTNEEATKVLAEYNQGSFESYRKKCIDEILLYLGVEVNPLKNTAANIRSQAIEKILKLADVPEEKRNNTAEEIWRLIKKNPYFSKSSYYRKTYESENYDSETLAKIAKGQLNELDLLLLQEMHETQKNL